MQIEVIAIGNEVLSGFTVNSNAAYISKKLTDSGIRVTRHSVLPDDPVLLKEGLLHALQHNDIVLTTGGLGPTCDDLTRTAAAELFHSEWRFDEEIASDLKLRYGDNLPSIQNQATLPAKTKVLKNSVGTAPGLIFKSDKSILILMPGVPPEMRVMFSEQVLPYLKNCIPVKERRYYRKLQMFGVPEIRVDPLLRTLKKEFPSIDFGIYPHQGLLEVHLSIASDSEQNAMSTLSQPLSRISREFSPFLFEAPEGRIELAVHQHFTERKLTLSTAESCTGGSVAARLTQIPGASHYFLGAIIAYSNALKTELLGVPQELLHEYGAVSSETVASMLQGALDRTQSDYAVAATGIAGPTGGTPEKPVGTVWCAVGRRNAAPKIWKLQARGSREMVIERSVNILLAELLAYAKNQQE